MGTDPNTDYVWLWSDHDRQLLPLRSRRVRGFVLLTTLACTCRSVDCGERMFYRDWAEFRLPDFSIRFLGCIGDEGCDLYVRSATDVETFHWESQPTCLSPLPFDLDGASYVLEVNCSVVDPTLATSFMVVWRHDDFERQRSTR